MHAQRVERFDRLTELDGPRVDGECRLRVQIHFGEHRLAGLPAVFAEVIGGAGDHVVPVGPQVAFAVAVPVDRELAIARRHELRASHRARVRAERHGRLHRLFAGEQHELFQLLAEVGAPLGKIECQRGERVEHAIAAHDAAVLRLDADDGDDVFGRDAALGRDPFEPVAILFPELHALGNAFFGEKARAIFPPRRDFLGRLADQLDDLRLGLRRTQHLQELGATDLVALRDLIDECLDVGPLEIEVLRVRIRARGQQRKRCDQGGAEGARFAKRKHL